MCNDGISISRVRSKALASLQLKAYFGEGKIYSIFFRPFSGFHRNWSSTVSYVSYKIMYRKSFPSRIVPRFATAKSPKSYLIVIAIVFIPLDALRPFEVCFNEIYSAWDVHVVGENVKLNAIDRQFARVRVSVLCNRLLCGIFHFILHFVGNCFAISTARPLCVDVTLKASITCAVCWRMLFNDDEMGRKEQNARSTWIAKW